jgi:hypothetical protein
MSLTTIPGFGLWMPCKSDESYQIGGATYVLDASGERMTVTFRAPKTGTLTRFEVVVSALTNAPDNGLKFSFQSASATDGMPSGTILGATAGAHVTTAGGSPSATGWLNPGDFGETVAVIAGDVLCAVVEFGGAGFTAGDNLGFGGRNRCSSTGIPFATSASGTKQATNFPIIALRYNDGTYAMVDDEIWPSITHGDFDIDTGTAKNECGLRFSVPVEMTLRAFYYHGLYQGANSQWELYLYDSGGLTVAGPVTIDGDHASSSTTVRWYQIVLPQAVTIAANSEYILGMKPTTIVNFRMTYYTFASSALLDAVPGGSNWYAVDRAWSGGTPGAWTRYNNGTDGYRRPRVLLNFSDVHDGAGGAAIGGTRPFRVTRKH